MKLACALIGTQNPNFEMPSRLCVLGRLADQAVPIIGAVGGAVINLLFMGHCQETARGRFLVRRLERHYGEIVVQWACRELVTRESSFGS